MSRQIKEEDSPVNSDHMKCTCMKSRHTKKHRQVLVNFGLNRKKVFTLNEKKGKLSEQFTSYVLSEPAFSGLLKDTYVVFQEFSEKFGTWVDVEPKETFRDGALLNAVFFPIEIERDESNPGSIRRKQKELEFIGQNCVKRSRPSEIILIDHSDEDNVENKDSNEIEVAKKQKKIKKSKKGSKMRDVKKEVRETKRKRKNTQEEGTGESSTSTTNQTVQEDGKGAQSVVNKKPPLLPTPLSTELIDFNNSQSSRNQDSSPGSETDIFKQNIQKLEELCAERSWPAPLFEVMKDDDGVPFCKVVVNKQIYFAYHRLYSLLQAAAAHRALSCLTPNRRPYIPYKPYFNSYHGPRNSYGRGKPYLPSKYGPSPLFNNN